MSAVVKLEMFDKSLSGVPKVFIYSFELMPYFVANQVSYADENATYSPLIFI